MVADRTDTSETVLTTLIAVLAILLSMLATCWIIACVSRSNFLPARMFVVLMMKLYMLVNVCFLMTLKMIFVLLFIIFFLTF